MADFQSAALSEVFKRHVEAISDNLQDHIENHRAEVFCEEVESLLIFGLGLLVSTSDFDDLEMAEYLLKLLRTSGDLADIASEVAHVAQHAQH